MFDQRTKENDTIWSRDLENGIRVRHLVNESKTFSPKVKSMNSSFMKNVYIFDIFYHFPQFEQSKSEV